MNDRKAEAELTQDPTTPRYDSTADGWDSIEGIAGALAGQPPSSVDRLCESGTLYARAKAVIVRYDMGLTRHVHGDETLGVLVNHLLLPDNIGRLGTGISPVRGHSHVQSHLAGGIAEKPELMPLDRLAEMFGFDPSRGEGMTTIKVAQVSRRGSPCVRTISSRRQFIGGEDRWRGLSGNRMIALMRPEEITCRGLAEGGIVARVCAGHDGHSRRVGDLMLIADDLPDGCVGSCHPETNPLIPVGPHERRPGTPACKGTPVRIEHAPVAAA